MTKWSDLFITPTAPLGQLAYLNTADAAHLAPGAAVGNLGYTPANRAGDNFQGPVAATVLDVGPTNPVNWNGFRLDSDGATNSKISFNYGSNCYMNYRWSDGYLNLAVNNIQTMGLDASGNAVFPGYVLGATLYAGGNTNGPAIGGSATDSHVYLDINTQAQWYYYKPAGDLYWYQAGNQNAHFSPNGDFWIRGNLSGVIGTFSNYVRAPVVYVGDNSMYMQTDANGSYVVLNGWSCRLSYAKTTGVLSYIVNDANVFNIDLGGSIHTNGNLTCNGAANIAGSITCPDIYPCTTGRFRITGNANQSYLFFDTAGSNQSYMYWDYNTTQLQYVSGGVARLTITYAGQATFANGVQVNGTFGCASQGFFTGNLTAAVNNGVNANCVMVGYFTSGAWYNANQAGVHISGTAAILAYSGSASNVQWSVAASDRRLKDNIERPSRDALDVVRKLPIWSCDYIAPRSDHLEDPEAWPEFREHWPFSFMADEVDAAMPNATIKDDEGRPVALHPQHLIATLWAAVQHLTDRLESAEAKLAAFPGVAP